MLIDSTLEEYYENYHVEWADELPENCPPNVIKIPHSHDFLRVTQSDDKLDDSDLVPVPMLRPNGDYSKKMPYAYGLSVFERTGTEQIKKLLKLPAFKDKKGIAIIRLNPKDGVVNQSFKKGHFTWWRTKEFDKRNVEVINHEKI